MKHAISCTCGKLQGHILNPSAGIRAQCYCRDCQMFAGYLQKTADILDAAGGTEVVGLRHSNIEFTQGLEYLKCMSLSEQGLLRWYADCCNTPIGNTPRDHKVSHLGLIHSCILGTNSEYDAVFGPVQLTVHTRTARLPVTKIRAGFGLMLRHSFSMFIERLSGRYHSSPFFKASGVPIVEPQILTEAQRQALQKTISSDDAHLS